MPCKHRKEIGDTTKYFYCQIFKKPVDDYKCNGCMMKIEAKDAFNDLFGQIFGKGFNK